MPDSHATLSEGNLFSCHFKLFARFWLAFNRFVFCVDLFISLLLFCLDFSEILNRLVRRILYKLMPLSNIKNICKAKILDSIDSDKRFALDECYVGNTLADRYIINRFRLTTLHLRLDFGSLKKRIQ